MRQSSDEMSFVGWGQTGPSEEALYVPFQGSIGTGALNLFKRNKLGYITMSKHRISSFSINGNATTITLLNTAKFFNDEFWISNIWDISYLL